MPSIKEIQAPIAEEMKAFSGHFRETLRSDVALLDIIMRYIVKRKGKQMRPIFVFLSAKIHGGCTEKTYTAASLIELLHTATLVHDDVVDESNLRRGFFSIQTPFSHTHLRAHQPGRNLLFLLLLVHKTLFTLLSH